MHCKFITKIFLFVPLILLSVQLCPGLAADKMVTVERVVDGDTIQVRNHSGSFRVRLWGIDTPEYRQPYSQAAKKFIIRLLGGKQVSLKIKDRDDYGRTVATVRLADGRIAAEELLKAGMAWVHIYYCKEPICNKWYAYEAQAREQKKGLWREKSPTPPWVWKHRKK